MPHAVIETERLIPSPIWVVAVLGAENLLRIDLDVWRGEESYVQQTLDELRKRRKECHGLVPGFGAPTGFTINYSTDRAILYALDGRFIEERAEPRRIGWAWLTIR